MHDRSNDASFEYLTVLPNRRVRAAADEAPVGGRWVWHHELNPVRMPVHAGNTRNLLRV